MRRDLHVIADHRDSARPWVAGTRCGTWTAIHHTDHTEGPVMSGSVDWTTDATWTAIHHTDHTEGPLS